MTIRKNKFSRLLSVAMVIALVLSMGVAVAPTVLAATVVDEEWTVSAPGGVSIRATHATNGTIRGALARNSVVRVDRRTTVNGHEWVRIRSVITRASGSNGASNANMVGSWMAVRNTSSGAVFANRTSYLYGTIHALRLAQCWRSYF